MVREATRDTVADIEVEVDRPGDRARKLDTLRSGDNTTQSVTGSGASETDWFMNNSAGDWYIERMTFGTAGASPGTLVAIIRVKDSNGALVYGMAGCCNQNNLDFDGSVVKPGWKVTYEILQGDSSSYTVNLWPMVRKPAPSTDSSGSSSPEPDTVVDNFEDGDISEYSGTTANAAVQTAVTYQGSNALRFDGNASTTEEITSTTGLDNYPAKGDRFAYYIRASTNDAGKDCRTRFGFDTTDTDNTYRVIHEFDGGAIELRKEESNTTTDLAGGDFNLPADEWCKVVVDYSDTITVDTYDGNGDLLGSISAADSLAESSKGGGILLGNFQSTGEDVYFDYIEIL